MGSIEMLDIKQVHASKIVQTTDRGEVKIAMRQQQ